MEHEKALSRIMLTLLKDDTEVYKQFVENDAFRRHLKKPSGVELWRAFSCPGMHRDTLGCIGGGEHGKRSLAPTERIAFHTRKTPFLPPSKKCIPACIPSARKGMHLPPF
jgi:hypothetical protein